MEEDRPEQYIIYIFRFFDFHKIVIKNLGREGIKKVVYLFYLPVFIFYKSFNKLVTDLIYLTKSVYTCINTLTKRRGT